MGSSMWADGHQGRVSKRPSIAPSASKRPEAISGKGLMDEGRQRMVSPRFIFIANHRADAITGVHPRYPIETSASQNLHESATYNMLAEMDAGIRAVQDENLKPKTSFNPKQNPNPSPVVSRGPRVQQPLILAGSSNSTERDAAEFPFGSKYPRGIRTKEDAMKYDKYKHFFETGSEGARDDASDAHNLQPKIQQQPAQGKLEPSKQVGLADEWSAPTTRYNPVGSPALDLSRQAAKNLQPQKPVANYAIKLWKNGFTIDDGPLYDISIPQNARFLTQIRRGIAPGQLMRVSPGQQVQVTLSEHGKPYPAAQSQSKGSEKPAPLSQKRDEAPSRQQGTPQPNAQEIGRRPTASRGAQPTQDPAPPKSSSHPPPNEVAPPIAPKKTISNLMSSVISTVHEQGYAKPPSRFEEKKAVTPIQPRKKNGQPFSISRTTTMYEETPEGRVVVDDDDWPKENRKTITNGLGLSLSTFEVVDNRPSHWQMASKGDPASSKPERATKAEPTLSSQKVAQGLCERVKDSKGKPENLTMDDKLVSWLNKGAAIHERLQKQDPRAKSRTPAQVWGRGLVGENRGNSPNTPSSTHFGDLAGLQQNRMTDSAEKRRKEQLSLDHDFAVALEIQDWQRADGQLSAVDDYSSRAHQVFTDHEIAMAEDAKEREVQRAGAIDSNVSRAIAARDPNAPVFVPDPEILKYIGEPGYAKKEEPEQLLCNICTSSKKSYHTFELLQAHKLQRHHYCAQCDIDFTDAETLHEHKDKTEQHWFCIICNFDFAAHESLVEHRKQGTYPCSRIIRSDFQPVFTATSVSSLSIV